MHDADVSERTRQPTAQTSTGYDHACPSNISGARWSVGVQMNVSGLISSARMARTGDVSYD